MCACARVRACVRACVRGCVHARACACVRVRVRVCLAQFHALAHDILLKLTSLSLTVSLLHNFSLLFVHTCGQCHLHEPDEAVFTNTSSVCCPSKCTRDETTFFFLACWNTASARRVARSLKSVLSRKLSELSWSRCVSSNFRPEIISQFLHMNKCKHSLAKKGGEYVKYTSNVLDCLLNFVKRRTATISAQREFVIDWTNILVKRSAHGVSITSSRAHPILSQRVGNKTVSGVTKQMHLLSRPSFITLNKPLSIHSMLIHLHPNVPGLP